MLRPVTVLPWALSLALASVPGCVTDAIIARDHGDAASDALAEAASGPDASTDGEIEDATTGDGDDASAPGAITVEGEAAAYAEESNAQSGTALTTRFVVNLRRAGVPIDDATVTITSTSGAVVLVPSGTAGGYEGETHGYDGTYALDVRAGADAIANASLTGPALHVFINPLTDQHLPAGQDLLVQWAPTGAAAAEIEAADTGGVPIADTGSYTVAGTLLTAQTGESREVRVRVRRSDTMGVAGAAPGSTFRMEVRNEVRFLVDGAP